MRTILVTGGAGFIGGTYVRNTIARQDTRVINLDALTYAGNIDSLAPCYDDPLHLFVRGDISNYDLVSSLLKEHEPEAIVNFAAESHVDRSIDGPRAFVQTNVVGTVELLTAARHYWNELTGEAKDRFRFLHVSTDEVYGSLRRKGRFKESTKYAPNSPYSASKAAADHFVRAFYHTYGLPVLTTNCSNNYGPYQFPEKLIPLMILNAAEGRPLPIYGDGKYVRDWLHVDDHCAALDVVLQSGKVGDVYNIGGDCEVSNLKVVNSICKIVDRLRPILPHAPSSSLIQFVTDRPGHDRRYAINMSKIKRKLGWKPAIKFKQGLEQTVQWYLDNADWTERVTSGKYRRERLGLTAAAIG